MVKRPVGMTAFEFTVLAGLRAVQLSHGCTPRVISTSKIVVIAQEEIAAGVVRRCPISLVSPVEI
jgi:DNA-directed RNA polymerase subunit K/omega